MWNVYIKKTIHKIAIIFLSISLNTYFGCSKEPSHRDGSFEYPQHMFWLRNKETNFQLGTLIWGSVRNVCWKYEYQRGRWDFSIVEKVDQPLTGSFGELSVKDDMWPVITGSIPLYPLLIRERSDSVVECLTRDWGSTGLSLTGVTALWSLSKTHLS